MQKYRIEQIMQGLETAFINQDITSNLAYKPLFVSNNYKNGRKVLSSIEDELLKCDQFYISVAFITMSGLTPLLQTLKELEMRGIPGQIITTDYLCFSEPKALHKLANLKNIELKMYCTGEAGEGFHTKGYIFREDEIYRIIVGSSNITLGALTKNKEWNTKIVSTAQGEFANNIIEEFNTFWNSKSSKNYLDFIDQYTVNYELVKKQKAIAKQVEIPSIEQYKLQPNKMQVEFVSNLRKLRNAGEEKALLISATGTGKTYASAFALREENPKKALFVVHREQIAKQAMKSYKNVFGNTKKFGLISGNSKDYEADYLFSTMQMMAKPEIRERFTRDEFEIIIIDEVHRAGAESYQRIMEYFTPKFWLGMTASPDRTDGFNIYELFNHKIAYEIRLQQALEENMLCPFHYFGITDLEIDGEVFDDNTGIRNFAKLVCDARVDYVLEKAKYYGYSGHRVKGLVFCSRKQEAKELSVKFNSRGFHTEFLCSDDSQERREECIERLTNDDRTDLLDYIFTVDIFNEGVDIPEINQVIMLRPTESPIVFIQQLGRGLRKAENKEYVVILDFIGNYMNNFMIPIALSGDRTYNKDTIRRYVMEGSRIIPGSSTIHFDEISKKRIFTSIDNARTTKKMLKDKYEILKNKLGRVPSILDFYEYGEIDPMLFINYSKTYDRFVRMVDSDYTVIFNDGEEAILEFVSSFLVNGKRPHELLMLKMLMNGENIDKEVFQSELKSVGGRFNKKDYESSIAVLAKDFINTQTEKKKYEGIDFFSREEMKGRQLRRALSFHNKLNKYYFQKELKDLIEYGLMKYEDFYKDYNDENLVLYQKYSRKDVCRLLNWERDDSSTIYGYKIKNGTCPIFVTYEKKENIASSTKYEDQFINNRVFSWLTRSRVSIESTETQEIIHHKENGLRIFLFIKKSDGEGTDFYYMGKVKPIVWSETTIKNDNGKALPIMNFQMELEHSVRNDIYDYFTR
jgi:superfamily II DNA or RNA helicase/HKD family nuclease